MVLKRLAIAYLATAAVLVGAAQSQAAAVSDPSKADLRTLVIFMGGKFKKDFVIDPRVQGFVDLGGLTPDSMSYHAFLEVLGVHGFVAMPSDDVVTVVPSAQSRFTASKIVEPSAIETAADPAEVITVVIPVGNIEAAKLLQTLRILVPPWGSLVKSADEKSIILVDTAANAKRIVALVQRQTGLQ